MTQGVVGDAATRGIGKDRYEIMPGEGKGDCVGTHTRSDTPLTWMYVSFHYLCYHYYYYRRCLRTWEGATRGAPEREGQGKHTGGRESHHPDRSNLHNLTVSLLVTLWPGNTFPLIMTLPLSWPDHTARVHVTTTGRLRSWYR